MLIKKFNNIQFCPYISTEETIFSKMEIYRDSVSDDYELICLPLAHLINTIGIQRTNSITNSIKSNKKRVFVCQHIYVNQLSFDKSDIVFTPHKNINDNFISIPHFAVSVDTKLIEDRSIIFSFLGSTTTHWTRKKIVDMYDNCYDSGKHWGLETNDVDFKKRYIKLLGTSEFSLCPRGTGISSIRIFESMAMSSFPVIISDGYEPPLNKIIDWNKISVKVKESNIQHIPDILSEKKLDREYLYEVYNKYLSNENLHKTILETL